MFSCNNCNFPLEDGTRFCGSCGARVVSEPTLENAPQQSPQTPQTTQQPNQQHFEAPQEPQPSPQESPYQSSLNEQDAFQAGAGFDEPSYNTSQQGAQPPQQTQQYQKAQQPQPTQPMQSTYTPQQQIQTQQQVYAQDEQQFTPLTNQLYVVGGAPVQATKKPFPAKIVAVVATALAIVLIAAIALNLVLATKSRRNVALYLKNSEINLAAINKNKPYKVTNKFAEFNLNEDSKNEISSAIVVSKDGKTIFFPDNLDSDDDGLTMYHRSLTNTKKDAVRIDASIVSFFINEKADRFIYLRGDNNKLYTYNMKDKDKIADNVENYSVSDDGNRVIFLNDDGDLYLLDGKKDKEKIDSIEKFDSILYASDDFSKIYYSKEDSIYLKEIGKEKQKVAKDVAKAITVYESGEMYFYRNVDGENSSLMNYITDDLKESDAAMTAPIKPEYPKYPSYADYENDDDRDAAVKKYNEELKKYNEDYKKYWEDYDAFSAKTNRDTLRKRLEEESVDEIVVSELIYFDGKTESVVSPNCTAHQAYAYSKAALVYNEKTSADVAKIKMSEIKNIYDVRDKIEEAGAGETTLHFAVGEKSSAIENEEASSFVFNSDGTALYFFEDFNKQTYNGDLYKAKINKDGIDKPELYDDDVYSLSISFYGDSILYFKDMKKDVGDLYFNKNEVDSGVARHSISYENDFKVIRYLADWNSDKEQGILKVFNGGKATTVDQDVHDFTLSPNGDILYLKDYRSGSNKGDLYVNKGGKGGKKSTKIDEDVNILLRVYNYSGKRLF